ncbi:MAG: oligosaccharide flippase family protein [Anaerolineales bacterium]|nr:oligosaccharide flippase family protein [Anaerolineales bacterium]
MTKLLDYWTQRPGWLKFDPVTGNWLIIFSGTAVRIGLNFLAGIIITRTLGPTDFGIYSVLLAAASLIGVAVDAGLTEAAVKTIAVAWASSRLEAVRQSRLFFWLKLGLAGVGVALSLLLAPVIVPYLLRLPGYGWLFALTLVGVVTTTLSGSVNAILQAIGKFSQISMVLIISSGGSLVLAAGLALLGQLNLVTTLLGVSAGTSLIGFFIGYRALPADWPSLVAFAGQPQLETNWREPAQALFRFGGWLWLANIGKVLLAYLDMFLINLWLDPITVGIYALALGLSRRTEIVNHSLYTVLLPMASALKSGRAIRTYLYQGLVRSALISLLLLILIPVSQWFIPLIYGGEFAPAVRLFQWLLGLAIFDILTLPPLLLVYTFERSQIAALAEGLRVVILVAVSLWLVSSWGVYGVIVAKLIAKVVGVVVTLGLLLHHDLQLRRTNH